MDADTKELLREVERENELRLAYIAGVGKGMELAQRNNLMKSEFEDEVRDGFRGYIDD